MRKIVTDAFECDELVYQFTRIDVEDGLLKTGSMEEVNEKFSDEYIISEAENRLDISSSNCVHKCPADMDEMERTYWKEWGQLNDFLVKYKWEKGNA
jgi:hypothetical protein